MPPAPRQVSGDVRCMVTAAGGRVWTAERDGSIAVRAAENAATIVKTLHCPDDYGWALHYDGTTGLVWSGHSKGIVRVWDAAKMSLVQELKQHAGGVYVIVGDAQGRVFTASNDFTIRQWDSKTFDVVKLYSGHANQVRALQLAGSYLFSGSDDGTIRVWNADTGHVLQVLQACPSEGGVLALALADGELWSGCEDGSIKVWDVGSGALVATLEGHTARVGDLVRVGDEIWSGGADKLICVWAPKERKLVATHRQHKGYISAMAVVRSTETLTVWSCGNDKVIRSWPVHRDRQPGGWADGPGLDTHSSSLAQLASNEITELREALDDLQRTRDREVAALDHDLTVARNESDARGRALDEARTTGESDRTQRDARIADLERRNREMEHALNEAVATIRDEQAQVLALEEHMRQIVHSAEQTQDRMQAEIDQLRGQASGSALDAEALRRELTQARAELERMQSEAAHAGHEMERHVKARASIAAELREANDQICRLQESLASERMAKSTLLREIGEERIENNEFRMQTEQQLDALRFQIRDMTMDHQRTVGAERHTAQQLSATLAESDQIVQSTRAQLHETRAAHESLQTEYDRMREQLALSAAALARSTNERTEVVQVTATGDVVAAMAEEIEGLKAEIDTLRRAAVHSDDVDALHAEIDELHQLLDQTSSQRDESVKKAQQIKFVLRSRGDFVRDVWALVAQIERARTALADVPAKLDGIPIPKVKRDAVGREVASAREVVDAAKKHLKHVVKTYFADYEKLHLGIPVAFS